MGLEDFVLQSVLVDFRRKLIEKRLLVKFHYLFKKRSDVIFVESSGGKLQKIAIKRIEDVPIADKRLVRIALGNLSNGVQSDHA